MNKATIKTVKEEIIRLLNKISALETAIDSEDVKKYGWCCPKETGAVSRPVCRVVVIIRRVRS